MDKDEHNTINIQIQNLTEKVAEGFKGIHDRQDKTNGKVGINTEFRLVSEGSLATIKWVMGFVGVGNVVLLIKVVFV